MTQLFNRKITTPTIDKNAFRQFTTELVSDHVYGDTSTFKELQDQLTTYLDTAVDLDPTQKAGIYADFLKDAYVKALDQSMKMSFQVLNSNADFELKSLAAEVAYNTGTANIPKILEETALISENIISEKLKRSLIPIEIQTKQGQYAEVLAKLRKQYGVEFREETTIGDGVHKYAPYKDGKYYVCNDGGAFISVDGTTIIPDQNPTGGKGLPAVLKHKMHAIHSVIDVKAPGMIDKQIEGYDVVNLKDALKTLDERAALMQNAKVAPTQGENQLRALLLSSITGAQIQLDPNGNYTMHNATPPPGNAHLLSCKKKCVDGHEAT